MNRPALTVLLTLTLALFMGRTAISQVVMRPTPLPTVTAESEPWYLDGQPITYAGALYYPAGPAIFFNPSEMVRSGFYQGIPLYARTTIEPYSIVYVPLAGGRMQPYERPRSGELAGTSGSMPALVPTPPETDPAGGYVLQAQGPPSQTTQVIPMHVPSTSGTPSHLPPARSPHATGMAGRGGSPRLPTHTRIGGPPQGTNSIFIEFQNTRWYPTGPADLFDTSGLVLIDKYFGFDVWAPREGTEAILIPVTPGGTMAVTYTKGREQ